MITDKNLDYTNKSDWDVVQISSPEYGESKAFRINVARMSEQDRIALKKALALLQIKGSWRKATQESEHVKVGDPTCRVAHPADVEKLSLLFKEVRHPEKDWRNLLNWDSKEYTRGTKTISGYGLNVQYRTMGEVMWIQMVLSDLGIDCELRQSHTKTRHMAFGDTYLAVKGKEDMQKLREFTRRWSVRPIKRRDQERG